MRIKKAQLGAAMKTAGKNAVKSAKKVSSASNKISKSKIASEFPEFNQNFMTTKPSGQRMRDQIKFDYTGKKAKYKAGGKLAKAKSGKSFPDLNKDGKITKADILKGRGVIKNGGKLKKARGGASLSPTAANVSKRLGSRLRAGGTLSPTGSSVSRRLASPFKNKKARGGASLSPSGTSTSNRLASNLKMKHGGKAHMKKAMGGYKMMKMGGKCRGGCY